MSRAVALRPLSTALSAGRKALFAGGRGSGMNIDEPEEKQAGRHADCPEMAAMAGRFRLPAFRATFVLVGMVP